MKAPPLVQKQDPLKGVVDLKKFTLTEGGTLVADVSDLDRDCVQPIRHPTEDLGMGVLVRSHHTGKVVWFRCTEAHRDREGETTHWTFEPLEELDKVKKLIIFND